MNGGGGKPLAGNWRCAGQHARQVRWATQRDTYGARGGAARLRFDDGLDVGEHAGGRRVGGGGRREARFLGFGLDERGVLRRRTGGEHLVAVPSAQGAAHGRLPAVRGVVVAVHVGAGRGLRGLLGRCAGGGDAGKVIEEGGHGRRPFKTIPTPASEGASNSPLWQLRQSRRVTDVTARISDRSSRCQQSRARHVLPPGTRSLLSAPDSGLSLTLASFIDPSTHKMILQKHGLHADMTAKIATVAELPAHLVKPWIWSHHHNR